jgi:hypothetical protein
MFVKLERFPSSEKQTLGIITVCYDYFVGDILCALMTLELPRKQNQKRISCIPPGNYTLHPHTSPKFGQCLWVKAADNNPVLVGGRSEILIHSANYHFQLLGCIAPGLGKDGKDKTLYIYNICDHEDAYAETGNQAVSYTTGVPAMIGAAMLVTGKWSGAGVWNMEQFDPDPFMDMLNAHGLPWTVEEMDGPVGF